MTNPIFDESQLTTSNGVSLFLRRARVENPLSDVLLVHGMGEHSARYFHVAEYLAQRRHRLCAFDLRGHGRSSGDRGILEDYTLLLDDLEAVWRHHETSERPMFLYGHSMGAQVALHFIHQRRPAVRGAVIASPWLQLAFKPRLWKLWLARLSMRIHPNLVQNSGTRIERMSRDLNFLGSMRDLHLVHHRISARMYFTLVEAGEAATRAAGEFRTPLLMIHGAADPVTSAVATEEFFHRAAAPDKTLKIYPGTLHETHNDLDRGLVLSDIADWLDSHIRDERFKK